MLHRRPPEDGKGPPEATPANFEYPAPSTPLQRLSDETLPIDMTEGRDVWWHDAVGAADAECDVEWVDAEHPLFVLYTSGSTGKPKGVLMGNRAVMTMVRAYQEKNEITEDSISLQLTTFTWDIHGQAL